MKYSYLILPFIFLLALDLYSPVVVAKQRVYVYKQPNGSYLFSGKKLHRNGYRLLRIAIYASSSKRTNHPHHRCFLTSRSVGNKNFHRYKRIIGRLANSYQLDPLLIRSIISVESCYNPDAKSGKGARGLMQVMPTVKNIHDPSKLYNPMMNLKIGIAYFKTLMNRYANNTTLALAAYNAGSNAVKKYNGVPPYPQTTRYITKVMMHYHSLVADKGSR